MGWTLMAVYMDMPFLVPKEHPTAPKCMKGRKVAHLMADSHQELIRAAKRLGCNLNWIQCEGTMREHFDIVGAKLKAAMEDDRTMRCLMLHGSKC